MIQLRMCYGRVLYTHLTLTWQWMWFAPLMNSKEITFFNWFKLFFTTHSDTFLQTVHTYFRIQKSNFRFFCLQFCECTHSTVCNGILEYSLFTLYLSVSSMRNLRPVIGCTEITPITYEEKGGIEKLDQCFCTWHFIM